MPGNWSESVRRESSAALRGRGRRGAERFGSSLVRTLGSPRRCGIERASRRGRHCIDPRRPLRLDLCPAERSGTTPSIPGASVSLGPEPGQSKGRTGGPRCMFRRRERLRSGDEEGNRGRKTSPFGARRSESAAGPTRGPRRRPLCRAFRSLHRFCGLPRSGRRDRSHFGTASPSGHRGSTRLPSYWAGLGSSPGLPKGRLGSGKLGGRASFRPIARASLEPRRSSLSRVPRRSLASSRRRGKAQDERIRGLGSPGRTSRLTRTSP